MLTVREVEDKDIIPLVELLPKVFPDTTKEFWLTKFESWWTSNPAYTDQFPRGWVLKNETSIVGFIGNIPVKFLICGAVKIAAVSNSWYVDSHVRGIFSLSLFHEYLKQKSASLFLFKEDYESLWEILHKYKFEKYILPRFQKDYVYIINKKKVGFIFLKFLFNNRKPKLSELLELYKKFGFLIYGYLYQKSMIQWVDLSGKAYITSLCTFCDDSFSKIWEPYLNTCDVSLSRDTKTLNWLYFSPDGLHKRVVIQCHRSCDKSLAGYMVFDFQHLKPPDGGSMQLMDLCIENNDPCVLDSLMSFAIEMGKQNNAALLIVCANNQETETYFRSRFTMRRAAHYYRYIRFSNIHEMNLDMDNQDKVCLPLIYPPQ